MAGSLDSIVGHRIWLDYYDQNDGFDEAFTPQSCEVVKRFRGAFGEFDWYLIELDTPVVYEGRKYVNLMIRSRWIGYRIGDEDPTSVFIVLVPDAGKLTDPFSLDQDLFVAWGMAFKDTVASRNETLKRKKTKEVMQSIRTILFDDWDPFGGQ
ncbi:MAG: hypothetical protein J5I65_01585 [Aridibacter famidurans]|nr:hypothetical protein [Aridibacter famidurans]